MKHCILFTPSSPPPYLNKLTEKLSEKGVTVTHCTWMNQDDATLFDPEFTQLVIITDASVCPAFLSCQVDSYLKRGGRVIVLGGPPFQTEFYSLNNTEKSMEDFNMLASTGQLEQVPILSFQDSKILNAFTLDQNNPDSKKVDAQAHISIIQNATIGSAFCWETENFYINESFEIAFTIPEEYNSLGFFAWADENTRSITIQLIEDNGNCFKTQITPKTSPSYHLLSRNHFVFCGNRNNAALAYAKNRPEYPDFTKVRIIQFGHALSHAYSCSGEHKFYIGDISGVRIPIINDTRTIIEGLCPAYKFYPVTNAAKMLDFEKNRREYVIPSDFFSHSPRSQSTGFQKGRRARFIPILETIDKNDMFCGYPAYLIFNYSYNGDCPNPHNGSALAAFCINDDSFYLETGADLVVKAAQQMLSPVLLIEGGTEEYIYFDHDTETTCGATLFVQQGCDLSEWELLFHYGEQQYRYPVSDTKLSLQIENGGFYQLSFVVPPNQCRVKVSLLFQGGEWDFLSHECEVFSVKSPEERNFAKIEHNEIIIAGQPVRFYGVNYMPSCNIGMETYAEFEHYIASFAYDPQIIENDLKRICSIGMNSVSVFIHYMPSIRSNNLLHLISLCEKYGIYINLSLRPHADPFSFSEQEVREIIEKYHLNQIDSIVGYDIAWERYVGTYEPCYGNFAGRKSFDAYFREFLLNRYGSFEAAEKFFGLPLPRDKTGNIIGLSDDLLRTDDEHRALVAVYRRAINEAVAKAHIRAVNRIKEIDPNHIISARSGDASSIPLVDPGIYGYDYKALALAFDYLSPESYALSDDLESMRQGVFTNCYARYAKNDIVVEWMEFGKSIWTGSNFTDNSKSLSFQAEYYRRFLEMLLSGHTSGMYAWWYAGGYRVGENSDFGIFAPDGSDRPVTKVLRQYAKPFLDAPQLSQNKKVFFIDQEEYSDGIRSVYRKIETEFFHAIHTGKIPYLIDGGNDHTSAEVELVETGNLAPCGFSPKYLDGFLLQIKKCQCGHLIEIDNRAVIEASDEEVTFVFQFINSEMSTWLSGTEFGSICFCSTENSDFPFMIPLKNNVARRQYAEFTLTIPGCCSGKIEGVLRALERTQFGERVYISLIRK